MLKFIKTLCSGYETKYEIEMNKPYTVKEFIDEILTVRQNKWGEFKISSFTLLTMPENSIYIPYNRKTIDKTNIYYIQNKDKQISRVTANACWGQMQYNIILKPEKEV